MNEQERERPVREVWDAQRPAARSQNERLVALLIAGILALSFPLLSLFIRFALVFGIPLLYFYLFLVWALIIVSAYLIVRNRRPGAVGSSGTPGSGRE